MASKTKDRILRASRLLFNDEGVSNVAMVDIAATLDISPGNLYYHYRGKDELIPIIFEQFSTELSTLLNADISSLTSIEDRWAYQFLILETLYKYRCLHGLDAVRYDKSLAKRYQRLQSMLIKIIESLIEQLQTYGFDSSTLSSADFAQLKLSKNTMLAENTALFMFGWSNQAELSMDEKAELQFLHDGVFRIFYQLAVHVKNGDKILADCKQMLMSSLKA